VCVAQFVFRCCGWQDEVHEMPRDVVTSVCIPTYNRAGMLRRAIRSAQAQTERRIEILISDNASTDRTEDLVSGLAEADARIRYVRNARNLGMVGNWNRCLAEASAPVMCLLSDDDTLTPGAVAAGRDLLGRHPEGLSDTSRTSASFLLSRPIGPSGYTTASRLRMQSFARRPRARSADSTPTWAGALTRTLNFAWRRALRSR